MEISAEQLNRLKDGEYTVYDIRSETDRTYGFIPGSVHITAEELCENPPTDRNTSRRIISSALDTPVTLRTMWSVSMYGRP